MEIKKKLTYTFFHCEISQLTFSFVSLFILHCNILPSSTEEYNLDIQCRHQNWRTEKDRYIQPYKNIPTERNRQENKTKIIKSASSVPNKISEYFILFKVQLITFYHFDHVALNNIQVSLLFQDSLQKCLECSNERIL